jgi:hypothetical protein
LAIASSFDFRASGSRLRAVSALQLAAGIHIIAPRRSVEVIIAVSLDARAKLL